MLFWGDEENCEKCDEDAKGRDEKKAQSDYFLMHGVFSDVCHL